MLVNAGTLTAVAPYERQCRRLIREEATAFQAPGLGAALFPHLDGNCVERMRRLRNFHFGSASTQQVTIEHQQCDKPQKEHRDFIHGCTTTIHSVRLEYAIAIARSLPEPF